MQLSVQQRRSEDGGDARPWLAASHNNRDRSALPVSAARATGGAGCTALEYSNVIDFERLPQTATDPGPAPTTANDLGARSSHRGAERDGMEGGYSRRMSLASWVNGQADRMLERSTWEHSPMGVRVLAALGCWLGGLAAAVLTLMLLKAPRTVGITLTVTIELWFGVMLAAYATGSRSLMRVAIWGIPIVVLVPIGLAFAGE